MKSFKGPAVTIPSLIAGCALNLGTAKGTTVVLDSFDDGPFSLSFTNPDSIEIAESAIASHLVTNRGVAGVGVGEWTAECRSGALNFRSETPPGWADSRFVLDILYTHEAGSFSVLANDAVRFNFTELTGQGMLTVVVGDAYPIHGVRVPITSPGAFDYPYSLLNDTSNLGHVERLLISMNSDSKDFSITLDEVALVP